MAEFKIVGQEFPELGYNPDGTAMLDAAGNHVQVMKPWLTFLVDGKPSLKWFRECAVEGLPKDYYVQRCIKRLQSGFSREAFGDAPTILKDGVPVTVDVGDRVSAEEFLVKAGFDRSRVKAMLAKLPSGKGRGAVEEIPADGQRTTGSGKVVQARPRFRYVLDGKPSVETFPTEAAARAACAVQAFMTRGKLGTLGLIEAALRAAHPGKSCEVWACAADHEIKASVDGKQVAIGWEPDGSFRFKIKD